MSDVTQHVYLRRRMGVCRVAAFIWAALLRWAVHAVIGDIFTASGVSAKQTAPLGPGHRIGPPASSEGVLIVVWPSLPPG